MNNINKKKVRRNIITINSVELSELSEATCSLNGKICKNILIGLQWRRDNECNLCGICKAFECHKGNFHLWKLNACLFMIINNVQTD